MTHAVQFGAKSASNTRTIENIFETFILRCLFAAAYLFFYPGQTMAQPDSAKVDRTPTASQIGFVAADTAKEFVGVPYQYGGSTPSGFDCSGLVQFSFKKAGKSLPRRTSDLRLASRAVKKQNLRKGDLVFFNQEGKKSSHVGIYLGRGQFIHAPSTGGKVKIDDIHSKYWSKYLAEVRRVERFATRMISSAKRAKHVRRSGQ
jgi:murein DD-endopeptidase